MVRNYAPIWTLTGWLRSATVMRPQAVCVMSDCHHHHHRHHHHQYQRRHCAFSGWGQLMLRCSHWWGVYECILPYPHVKDRKKALKRVKSFPTANNRANYRIIRAKARRTMKTSKRLSWRSIVSKINSRTSIKKVWSMVHKIAGKKISYWNSSPTRRWWWGNWASWHIQ